MSEHTPIPWEVDPRANLRVRIKTGDRTVCSSVHDGYAPQIVAEHNSHDALVTALKKVLKLDGYQFVADALKVAGEPL